MRGASNSLSGTSKAPFHPRGQVEQRGRISENFFVPLIQNVVHIDVYGEISSHSVVEVNPNILISGIVKKPGGRPVVRLYIKRAAAEPRRYIGVQAAIADCHHHTSGMLRPARQWLPHRVIFLRQTDSAV